MTALTNVEDDGVDGGCGCNDGAASSDGVGGGGSGDEGGW